VLLAAAVEFLCSAVTNIAVTTVSCGCGAAISFDTSAQAGFGIRGGQPAHSFSKYILRGRSFPFNAPCRHPGMTAPIIVQSPNAPPTIFCDQPGGRSHPERARYIRSLTPPVIDGSVHQRPVLQGASPIGNVAVGPYSVAVNNLRPETTLQGRWRLTMAD